MKMNKESIVEVEEEILKNAKSIEYYTSEYTLEVLISKLQKGQIYIPEYQRKDIWDYKRKCRFIESILIGLPIPFLFFWQNPDTGKLEIVDGVQRLTVIKDFYENKLSLSKLERIPSANQLKFEDLLESRQLKFLSTSLRGIMLSAKADEEARFDLFERINTGSKIATPSELRRGLLQGNFYNLVEKLSMNSDFIELTKGISKQRIDQGERNELVSRFFAYSDGLEGYKGSVAGFIFKYIEKMNTLVFDEKMYENSFSKVMSLIAKYDLKSFRSLNGRISRTRFEAVSIGLCLAIKEDPNIEYRLSPDVMHTLRNNEDFNKVVTSDGANTTEKLQNRINFTKDFFLGIK